jgi:hypothetical protein
LAGNRNLFADSVIWLDGEELILPGEEGLGRSTGLRVANAINIVDDVLFLDLGCPAGLARGIHIPDQAGPFEGFTADVRIWGFEDPGDVFLDIEEAEATGLDITIRGNHRDNDNFPEVLSHEEVAKYIDKPADMDDSNVIRIINEATGQVLTIDNAEDYEE